MNIEELKEVYQRFAAQPVLVGIWFVDERHLYEEVYRSLAQEQEKLALDPALAPPVKAIPIFDLPAVRVYNWLSYFDSETDRERNKRLGLTFLLPQILPGIWLEMSRGPHVFISPPYDIETVVKAMSGKTSAVDRLRNTSEAEFRRRYQGDFRDKDY